MSVRKILIGLLIALSMVFLSFQVMGHEVDAAGVRALLFVSLTFLYWFSVKKKHPLFLLFFIIFTVAEVLNFIGWLIPIVPDNQIDYLYYFINFLYILAYALLIGKIVSSLNVLEIIKKYPIHLFVLIVLDVFSVIVVTNTTLERLSTSEYSMELIYNSVIMILLTIALLNFIHKDDKKAINLLLGAIFIFFSEVIQLAYFYVSDINLLNVVCSIFLLFAFLFFYLQANLSYQTQERTIPVESD